MIKCEDCGDWYSSVVWHSNSKYRRIVYRCRKKYLLPHEHKMRHLYEEEIRDKFVVAVNKLITEKDEIIENVKIMMDTVCDTAELEKELRGLQTEFEVLTRQIEELIAKNSIKALDQEEYQKSYEELVTKYDECRDKIEETNEKITKKQLKKASLKAYIKALPSWGLTES